MQSTDWSFLNCHLHCNSLLLEVIPFSITGTFIIYTGFEWPQRIFLYPCKKQIIDNKGSWQCWWKNGLLLLRRWAVCVLLRCYCELWLSHRGAWSGKVIIALCINVWCMYPFVQHQRLWHGKQMLLSLFISAELSVGKANDSIILLYKAINAAIRPFSNEQ